MSEHSWPPAPGEDAELSAYLTDDLDDLACRKLETRLAGDAELGARLDRLAETLVRLRRSDQVMVPEDVMARVTAGVQAATSAPAAQAAPLPGLSADRAMSARRGRLQRAIPPLSAAAAILAVVVVGGLTVVGGGDDAADESMQATDSAAAPEEAAGQSAESFDAQGAPDRDDAAGPGTEEEIQAGGGTDDGAAGGGSVAAESSDESAPGDPVAQVSTAGARAQALTLARSVDGDAAGHAAQRWDELALRPDPREDTPADACADTVDAAVEGTPIPVEIAAGPSQAISVIAHLVVVTDAADSPLLYVVVTDATTCALREVRALP